MGTILKQMLDGIFVIPLPEKTVELLEELCQDYTDTISLKEIENCCYTFILNQKNFTLETYLAKQTKEKYEESISLPHIAYRVLSEYVVYLAIIDEQDDYYETDKLLYSLTVRNMMVLRKGSYERLTSLSIIPKMYSFADTYHQNESQIEQQPESSLIPEIFDVDSFSDMKVTPNEDIFEEIKALAKSAEKQKYQEIISRINEHNISDPFILAYYAANLLAVNPYWKFVDRNPVKTLNTIIPPSKKTTKLKDIKDNQLCSNLHIPYDTKAKSSFLINYINGDINQPDGLADLKFTPLEFAVYMYYEFFLEELIKKYNE